MVATGSSSGGRRWMAWAGVVLAAAGVVAWRAYAGRAASFRGNELNPPEPAADFELVDTEGRPFRLSSLRGQVGLLFFGYTTCPDVCPTTLADLRRVHSALGAEAGKVRYLFVTVDPERDTPERLAGYLEPFGFGKAVMGLTGSPEVLSRVWQAYGVYVQKQPVQGTTGYLVDHTAYVYLVDPAGRLRVLFPYGTPSEDIAHDVRLVLKKG